MNVYLSLALTLLGAGDATMTIAVRRGEVGEDVFCFSPFSCYSEILNITITSLFDTTTAGPSSSSLLSPPFSFLLFFYCYVDKGGERNSGGLWPYQFVPHCTCICSLLTSHVDLLVAGMTILFNFSTS